MTAILSSTETEILRNHLTSNIQAKVLLIGWTIPLVLQLVHMHQHILTFVWQSGWDNVIDLRSIELLYQTNWN